MKMGPERYELNNQGIRQRGRCFSAGKWGFGNLHKGIFIKEFNFVQTKRRKNAIIDA